MSRVYWRIVSDDISLSIGMAIAAEAFLHPPPPPPNPPHTRAPLSLSLSLSHPPPPPPPFESAWPKGAFILVFMVLHFGIQCLKTCKHLPIPRGQSPNRWIYIQPLTFKNIVMTGLKQIVRNKLQRRGRCRDGWGGGGGGGGQQKIVRSKFEEEENKRRW